MKKKRKWSDKTEDETAYEMIKGLMMTQRHIPYSHIRDTVYQVIQDIKKAGFKFKKEK